MDTRGTLWRDWVLWAGGAVLLAALAPYLVPGSDPDWLFEYAERWPSVPILIAVMAAFQVGLWRVGALRERKFWHLWTLGLGLQLAVRITYLAVPFERWTNWHDLSQDLLYVLSFLAIILAVDLRPDVRPRTDVGSAVRRLEKAGIPVLLLGLLVYLALIPGSLDRATYDSWVPSMLLYVSMDVYLLVRLVQWRLSTRSSAWRRVVGWLAVTVALWLGLDLFETLEYAGVAPEGLRGTVADLPWYLPYVTVAVAAREYHRLVPRIAAEPREEEPRPPGQRLVSSLVISAMVLPVIHFTFYAAGVLDPETRAVRELAALVGMVTLVAMAFAHQALVARENRRLDALRRGAEARRDLLAAAVEQAGEAVIITDAEGRIEYVNPAFEEATGYAGAEVLGQNPGFLCSSAPGEAPHHVLRDTLHEGGVWSGMLTARVRDGTQVELDTSIAPVVDGRGQVVRYVGVLRDVTLQNQIERRLGQSQKMEALGTLAGGVAHDFNNLLHAITGYSELLRDQVPSGSQALHHVDLVLTAARRAKGIIQQIMSFSRQADPAREITVVEAVVEEGVALLRASLPSTIEIRWEVEPDTGAILADPAQLQQVFLNLGSNAGHAMGDAPGVLEVRAERIVVDATWAGVLGGVRTGDYVRLSVRDSGCGMEPEVLERIYEPFFTTKDVGAGTGLGLSVVHGIVKAHGGALEAESEVGEGTTVHVYFPARDEVGAPARPETPAPVARARSGKILVVDDEPLVLVLARRQLESLGFTVVTEGDVDGALQCFEAEPGAFDAVLTDLTMPGRTGVELAGQLKDRREDLPVLLMTGFGDGVADEDRGANVDSVLIKPFSTTDLAVKLDELLG